MWCEHNGAKLFNTSNVCPWIPLFLFRLFLPGQMMANILQLGWVGRVGHHHFSECNLVLLSARVQHLMKPHLGRFCPSVMQNVFPKMGIFFDDFSNLLHSYAASIVCCKSAERSQSDFSLYSNLFAPAKSANSCIIKSCKWQSATCNRSTIQL